MVVMTKLACSKVLVYNACALNTFNVILKQNLNQTFAMLVPDGGDVKLACSKVLFYNACDTMYLADWQLCWDLADWQLCWD